MAYAYTPGLKIAEYTKVRKERRLPLKGQVVAWQAGEVKAETVVARTQLPGDVEPLNIAGLLGVPPEDLDLYLVKKEGDEVKKDEPIVQTKGLFGLFKSVVKSPVDGFIESISKITGQAILRHPPMLVEINAYIDGIVTEIFENEGVVVETDACFIQGIFGIGGETNGILRSCAENPFDIVTQEMIPEDAHNKILIGGSLVTLDALKKAIKNGAKGIVVGGISDSDLKNFLGYEIGVAITGSEEKGITLVITEGFGPMKMADKTFKLLKEHIGEKASMNGATQIRAGVLRPEIIIPLKKGKKEEARKLPSTGLEIGSPVRVIREPYFGAIGKVTALPPELQNIETEAKVRILEVELSDGRKVTIPRANVEMIEE